MKQVKDSPDVDTDQPVSRQIESHVYDYYGWDPYWGGGSLMTGAIAMPFVPPNYLAGSDETDFARPIPTGQPGDPHLRSIKAVTGYHIHAADGEIGHVEDFLVDDAGWSIRYLAVDTKNWWPGKKVLISPLSIREVDWATKLIHLNVNRQKVQDGPPYDRSITVDGAYEETLLTYYGIEWVAP